MKKVCLIAGLLACIILPTQVSLADGEVNLYSARKENLIKPLLDQFSESTGLTVNLVTGGASELIKRLEAEGRNTPADLILTTDAGRLHLAKAKDLLQAVDSDSVKNGVPVHLRDEENMWVGLSQRSRVLVFSKERVKAEDLSSYEDLADPKWKGRICVRSSDNIYNQSLLASLIAHHGAEEAENWAKAVVGNMGRAPKGNDRAQVTAVATGECDIAIVNNYYIGNMVQSSKEAERDAVSQVDVFYPNQNDRGSHMNVSGIGITKHSKNTENAKKLIEFLISDQAQQWYADKNNEYPVREGISVSEIVASWGYPFKQDDLAMSTLGELNSEAVKIFDRAGWK